MNKLSKFVRYCIAIISAIITLKILYSFGGLAIGYVMIWIMWIFTRNDAVLGSTFVASMFIGGLILGVYGASKVYRFVMNFKKPEVTDNPNSK